MVNSVPVVMTAEVTDELSRVDGTAVCCRRAEVATLLRFCEALHIGAGRVVVIAEVETGSVARRLRQGITGLYGYPCAVQVLPPLGRRSGGRYVVQVIADGEALSRRTGLLDRGGRPVRGLPVPVVAGGACDAAAVWRGAFLVQGSLSEPGRSPVLEVGCPGPEAAMALVGAARRLGITTKTCEARGAYRVKVRDEQAIGELLTRMGATHSYASWQQRRLQRTQHRSTVQRLAPFEDANQERAAAAALANTARVQRALQLLGEGAPGHLRAAGALRLHHQHVSLEELGRLAVPPLTKDAVAGRLRRLLSLADRVAREAGVPDTASALATDLHQDH